MAFLETQDGGRVYYQHHRAEKLPIMLVHGWGMSSEYWTSTIEALLAADHGVFAIDQRGCGRSDRDFTDMSIKAIAGDVCAILDQCGVDRIVLNGWSLGGAVAVQAAQILGDRVAGLISTCGATPRYVQGENFPHGGTAGDVLAIADAITADRANFFHGLAQGASGEGASDAMVAWVERGFLATGPRASATLADLAALDQRDIFAAFPFPILSIGGTKDVIADPAIASFAAKAAQNGRLLMMETGHSPQLEQPAEYHQAIIHFLQELDQ